MSDSSSQSREVSPSADRANGDTDVGASSVVVEWESDLPEGMVQADTGGLHPIEFSDERLRALPDTWLNHVGLRYHLLFIESFLFSTPDGKLDSARSGTRIGVRFINTADRDIRGFRGTLTITDISHFTDVVIRVGYSVIGSIPAGAAVYWASRVPVDAWPDPSKLHVFLPHDVSLSISVDEVVYE